MPRPASYQRYSLEQRARVMALLLLGESASVLAQRFRIPRSTVRSWRREAHEIAGLPLAGFSLKGLLHPISPQNTERRNRKRSTSEV
jgi:transposase-like protein